MGLGEARLPSGGPGCTSNCVEFSWNRDCVCVHGASLELEACVSAASVPLLRVLAHSPVSRTPSMWTRRSSNNFILLLPCFIPLSRNSWLVMRACFQDFGILTSRLAVTYSFVKYNTQNRINSCVTTWISKLCNF